MLRETDPTEVPLKVQLPPTNICLAVGPVVSVPVPVKFPERVSVLPKVIVNVDPAAIFTDAEATPAELIVTVKPPSMKTTSPATGTDAPDAPPDEADHVAVLFQLLLATENRLTAFASSPIPTIKSIEAIASLHDLFSNAHE